MALRTGRELVQALRRGQRMPADGAIGSELLKWGIAPGDTVEANLSHTELVRGLHRSSIAAGAEIITTNTFGNSGSAAFTAGIELAEAEAKAAVPAISVFISVYPGELIEKLELVSALFRKPLSGSRLLLIETAVAIAEAVRATELARRNGADIVAATCHFQPDGLMPDGTSPEAAAKALQAAGASLVGGNCGAVPEAWVEVAQRMRAATDLPLLFQPNAGLPTASGDRLIYPADPVRFAQNAMRLFDAGVSVVGGCCGTMPAHIAAVCSLLFDPQRRE